MGEGVGVGGGRLVRMWLLMQGGMKDCMVVGLRGIDKHTHTHTYTHTYTVRTITSLATRVYVSQ